MIVMPVIVSMMPVVVAMIAVAVLVVGVPVIVPVVMVVVTAGAVVVGDRLLLGRNGRWSAAALQPWPRMRSATAGSSRT